MITKHLSGVATAKQFDWPVTRATGLCQAFGLYIPDGLQPGGCDHRGTRLSFWNFCELLVPSKGTCVLCMQGLTCLKFAQRCAFIKHSLLLEPALGVSFVGHYTLYYHNSKPNCTSTHHNSF